MQVPAHVEYERASSVGHALSLLSRPDTRVLAGGHSLIPMMKLRLAQPGVLVDINGLAELAYVRLAGHDLCIGALARHADLLDPAELRMRNLPRPGQFPYASQTGWVYDSGDYPRSLRLAMDLACYDELRKEQEAERAAGHLPGIGVSFFTEAVGAGPRKHMDIMGLGMADGAELRTWPIGTEDKLAPQGLSG